MITTEYQNHHRAFRKKAKSHGGDTNVGPHADDHDDIRKRNGALRILANDPQLPVGHMELGRMLDRYNAKRRKALLIGKPNQGGIYCIPRKTHKLNASPPTGPAFNTDSRHDARAALPIRRGEGSMRMLDEVFQLDDQFGEPFPHVKRDEELRVQECRRQLYDFEAMRLYDVAGVGVFTSRGEIVGLVPEGLEQEARDAMGSGIRAVAIDNFSLPLASA